MYHTSPGVLVATGVLATENGWTFTGWGLIGLAVAVSGVLTFGCLRRGNRDESP